MYLLHLSVDVSLHQDDDYTVLNVSVNTVYLLLCVKRYISYKTSLLGSCCCIF